MSREAIARAWEVWHLAKPEWVSVVNAKSRGAAISEKLAICRDVGWEVSFIDFRARALGGVRTSEDFKRCATMRGRPDLRCGMRVKVQESFGVLVGHNESANFLVLFETGSQHGGLTLPVHPNDLEVCDAP